VRPPPIAPSGAPIAAAQPAVTLSAETLTPEQVQGLVAQAEMLDQLDYFQVLRLSQTASPADVKKAFYRESRTFHPDRFFHLPPSSAKQAINSIYKRITEAYSVLREDVKRAKYLADITGPERVSKLRYTEATETELKAEAKKAQDEVYGTNPKARQFYKTALADLAKGALQAAERNLKSALTFEPSNSNFKEKLAEVQNRIEAERRGGEKDAFRIK
jgi:DnaJ-class molecular chaperone